MARCMYYIDMSGRDLLYKPQTPLVLPDDAPEGKKPTPGGKGDKPGLRGKARDIGATSGSTVVAKGSNPAAANQRVKGPAYKSAYFTKDVETARGVNQRSSSMKALRGAEGATDLKKITLPSPNGPETPEPAQLRAACELMGMGQGFEANIGTLLSRQGGWAQAKGVTVESLQARLELLEQMVRDRVAALARMTILSPGALAKSTTLAQAAAAQGNAMAHVQDLAAEAEGIIRGTTAQADGMHKRVAKALGIKTQ